MRKILPLLIVTVIICSCHQSYNASDRTFLAEEEAIPSVNENNGAPSSPAGSVERQEVDKKKIIKDGSLGIKVTDLQKAKERVDTLVKKYYGYYSAESFNNSDRESSYNMTIRIPCDRFEEFIAAIESGDGEILYKDIDARDVTDQFIDLETRLENKRNYLERYNQLLKQAKSIKDILDIEEKIRVLEEEIESTTGRLRYLSDQVGYSTLSLTLTRRKEFKYNPATCDRFSERLKQSVSKGWFGFVDFMLFVLKIWPFWIIVGVVVILWKNRKKGK